MMDQNRVSFETARLFEETSVNAFGVAVPGSWLPSIGLSMVSFGSGEFQRTNELNDPLGTFRESETAYLVTLAKGFTPRFALGANLKLVQPVGRGLQRRRHGVRPGRDLQRDADLRVGASMLNLGGPSITLRGRQGDVPDRIARRLRAQRVRRARPRHRPRWTRRLAPARASRRLRVLDAARPRAPRRVRRRARRRRLQLPVRRLSTSSTTACRSPARHDASLRDLVPVRRVLRELRRPSLRCSRRRVSTRSRRSR